MLFDTSAWIELFRGGKNAGEVKRTILKEKCYTSVVSIAEIINWAERERLDSGPMVKGVGELSIIMPLDKQIAVLAGRLNFERKKANRKWGMMDSFILATCLTYGFEVLSKDSDFRDLPFASILPQ